MLRWWERIFMKMISMDLRWRIKKLKRERKRIEADKAFPELNDDCSVNHDNAHEIEHLWGMLSIGDTSQKNDTPCKIGRGGNTDLFIVPESNGVGDRL